MLASLTQIRQAAQKTQSQLLGIAQQNCGGTLSVEEARNKQLLQEAMLKQYIGQLHKEFLN